jgi:aminopeptidase N
VDVVIDGSAVEVALSNQVIVPDANDDTWIKLRLDPESLANLPAVLPKVADGTTRAVIWNSIRDSVADAELDPRQALDLFVTAIEHEDSDIAVGSLLRWLEDKLLGGYLPYDAHRGAVADALGNKLAGTSAGSSLQLATARGFVTTTDDAATLAAWLDGSDVPDGLEIDADLRWSLVLRLVRLNAFGAAEIEAELARDTSTEGVVEAAKCRAALPDAKEAAWARVMTDPGLGVSELLATADGFWHPAQADVTAPYVERFFTDVRRMAEIRSGMVVPLTVQRIAPKYVIDADLIDRAEALIADETVAPGIRRQTANFADELRRAVEVRRTFG